MSSIIYKSPLLYECINQILYGVRYTQYHEQIAQEIGGLDVLDVCCGTGKLEAYVKSQYLGLDFSDRFVAYGQKKGLDISLFDLFEDEVPQSECVVMKDSLYQFYPHIQTVFSKLKAAATKKLIIVENIRTMADSHFWVLRAITSRLTDAGKGSLSFRFNTETLTAFFDQNGDHKLIHMGRYMMGVFELEK